MWLGMFDDIIYRRKRNEMDGRRDSRLLILVGRLFCRVEFVAHTWQAWAG